VRFEKDPSLIFTQETVKLVGVTRQLQFGPASQMTQYPIFTDKLPE
jgi:hypothetical protein